MFYKLVVLAVAIASCNAFPRASNLKLREIDGRIMGGDETTIEKHPWQVSLRYVDRYYCGGTLISKDTVLTSARCADGLLVGKDKVVVGTSSLSEGGTEFDIDSFVMNDKFDRWLMGHNIAVLKLKGEVEFSDSVKAAKLPEQNKTVADGTEVTVTGWGVQNVADVDFTDILREVQVNIVGKDECLRAYPDQFAETMICAGVPEGGKDACLGDSGSPLAVGDTLYGIVSWGFVCGEPGFPGVYTDVASLRDWIKENSGV